MELGCVASGLIHTFRFFRGSAVVSNKLGHVSVERHTKGGICFFFQIDYNKKELLFTASITRDDERFNRKEGRRICFDRAQNDAARTFRMPYTEGYELLDQVFTNLTRAEETGELQEKPFLRTLLAKMRVYEQQNGESAALYQDLLDTGVIVIVE